MELLSELLKILLALSNTLLYPVIILLVAFVFVLLLQLGGFLSEYSQRTNNLKDKLTKGHLSPFNAELKKIEKETKNEELRIIEIQRLIDDQKYSYDKKIEKTRLLIRIGPSLGLMGTLIPMGPALLGLTTGNLDEMANQFVIAFTSTVIGLFIGVVSLVISSIRKRWYHKDIKDIQYVCEKNMIDSSNSKVKKA